MRRFTASLSTLSAFRLPIVEGNSVQAKVRRRTGSTQVLTCEAKVVDCKCCELRKALDDKVDVRGWELVPANLEIGQGLKLGHGPRQGCRNV